MKKLLILLFSLFFLSSPSVFAQEDLSKINIDNLKRLSGSEIISAFSNTLSWGYYSKDLLGVEDYRYVEHIYANGDFDEVTEDTEVSGKWKIHDNQICSKVTKGYTGFPEKMFSCISVYTDFNEGEYYFYIKGIGLYAKSNGVMPLID